MDEDVAAAGAVDPDGVRSVLEEAEALLDEVDERLAELDVERSAHDGSR